MPPGQEGFSNNKKGNDTEVNWDTKNDKDLKQLYISKGQWHDHYLSYFKQKKNRKYKAL